jgi:lysophospholipase L1-like esterase
MRKYLAIGVVALLCVSACGGHHVTGPTPPPSDDSGNSGQPPPPPPPAPVLSITRIVAFGDSLTVGTTSPPLTAHNIGPGLPESYPFKLQTMLATRYTGQTIEVFNEGQPGQRATAAPATFSASLNATSPQLVLLMDGANDLLGDGDRAITPATNAMEDMVRDALRRGIPVMVASLPPQRGSGSRGAGASAVQAYNAALRKMAATKGATFVDVFAQFDLSLIGQDGLHPTEAGYDRLATIFQSAISNAFEVRN